MNPLTNMKNVKKLSEQELYTGNKTSWHDQYRDSAWIFVGGLPYDLTEGDIICIFSQYGEIVNINLLRDKDNGKSRGFCFLCYEDQRSTDLAVDNFNGISILKRVIRVDHVSKYKVPKQGKKTDAETKKLYDEGCAPKTAPVETFVKPTRVKVENPEDIRETLADQIRSDIKLPSRLPIYTVKQEKSDEVREDKDKNDKEPERSKHKKKKKRRDNSDSDSDEVTPRKSKPQDKERDEKKEKELPQVKEKPYGTYRAYRRSRSRSCDRLKYSLKPRSPSPPKKKKKYKW